MAEESSIGVIPPLGPALLGEFLGTTLLVVLGEGVVAADVLMNKAPDRMMITTALGLKQVPLAVYTCGCLGKAMAVYRWFPLLV